MAYYVHVCFVWIIAAFAVRSKHVVYDSLQLRFGVVCCFEFCAVVLL